MTDWRSRMEPGELFWRAFPGRVGVACDAAARRRARRRRLVGAGLIAAPLLAAAAWLITLRPAGPPVTTAVAPALLWEETLEDELGALEAAPDDEAAGLEDGPLIPGPGDEVAGLIEGLDEDALGALLVEVELTRGG